MDFTSLLFVIWSVVVTIAFFCLYIKYDGLVIKSAQLDKVITIAMEDTIKLLYVLKERDSIEDPTKVVAKLMKLSPEEAEVEVRKSGLDKIMAMKAACIMSALSTVLPKETIERIEAELR